MISQEAHRGENVLMLKVHAPEQDNERPTAVEIRVVRIDRLENGPLPAFLNRPQCGQKTIQTVAPAWRQTEQMNT
jgi:hypothetical protein